MRRRQPRRPRRSNAPEEIAVGRGVPRPCAPIVPGMEGGTDDVQERSSLRGLSLARNETRGFTHGQVPYLRSALSRRAMDS